MGMIKVLSPGLYTTVQDLGRRGWRASGVPIGGAVDSLALRAGGRAQVVPVGAGECREGGFSPWG